MEVPDKHLYSPIVWSCLLLFVLLVPLPLTYLLLPFIIGFGIYKSRYIFFYYATNHTKLILFFLLCSAIYFFSHRNIVLQLEIWSDEIIGLQISSETLAYIAKKAVSTGMFPPYHYWELWYWQKLVERFPQELAEMVLRIPSMMYHTFGAVLLSLVVGKLYERGKSTTYLMSLIVRWTVFISYFFQPLLFQYAFEARPYSLIAFSGVVSLALFELEKTIPFADFYIRILLSLTSFIQTVQYMFHEVVRFKIRKTSYVTLFPFFTIMVLYALLFISIRKPIQTTQLEVYNSIVDSYVMFQHMFLSGFFQFIVLLAGIGFSIGNKKRMFVICQIFFLFTLISIIAYTFRYVALYPRHFILIVPFILYILFSWITSRSQLIQISGVFAICAALLIPWIATSESNLMTKNFPPKVETAIKPLLVNVSRSRLAIALEEDTHDIEHANYWKYRYQEYVALWYLGRYGYTDIIRVPTADVCVFAATNSAFVITYTDPQCSVGSQTIVKLDYKEGVLR